MKKAVFTVVNQLEQTPQSLLQKNDATIIYMQENSGKRNGLPEFSCSAVSAKSLVGEDYNNLRFFWPQEQLRTFVALSTARSFLLEGCEATVFVAGKWEAECGTESMKDCIVQYIATMPEAEVSQALCTEDLPENTVETVFYNGSATLRFLDWALARFVQNYQNGFSTISDKLHTGREGDREASFAFEWLQYAPLFAVKATSLPAKLGVITKSQNTLQEEFDDGTVIHPLLKPYFARNYRLRIACGGNPQAHRLLFTEKTMVLGEESGVPLTAMADCIWQNRPDLQSVYPDPKVESRIAYLQWYIENARQEYDLPSVYTEAVANSLRLEVDAPKEQHTKKRRIFRRQATVENALTTLNYNLEKGVNLCGHIRGEYGIGEASRMLALSLDAVKQPFTVVDIASERNYSYSNTQWIPRITNTFPYNINLVYTNADGVQPFMQDVSPDALRGRYNIGFWAWEMPEFPDEWSEAFAPFDEIWSLSQFSADAIAAKSPVPVHSMPHPVVLEAPDARFNREFFGLPKDKFIFLAMYDVRSVPQRKNPEAAIQAFVEAFGTQQDVCLALKVNAPAGWKPEESLQKLLDRHKNIILLNSFLSRGQLNGLLASIDAYVSLHRSEGFGFGPAEAMLYGKPAVVTNWSGSTEYIRQGACCPVGYSIVELERDYGPYRKGWHWAEPSVEEAAAYMQRLKDTPNYYAEIAKNGQILIQNEFSAAHRGEKISARLVEIGKR